MEGLNILMLCMNLFKCIVAERLNSVILYCLLYHLYYYSRKPRIKSMRVKNFKICTISI